MEGRLLLLCAVFGLWFVEASEDVASSKVIADTNKDLGENPHEAKNASYFVNPKRFLTYVDQIDKIKSLGDEVHCKLHGSCSEKKNKVAKKINSKASKKSIASRPRDRMPDNHNNVLSPEALMNPVAGGILGGNEYTQQPGAASFGQQPQMNVKVPRNPMEQEMGPTMVGPPMQMGSQAQPMNLDQMQNAENEASIQNSIRAKMDFMDKANGPQMALPGMSGVKDLAPGGVPDGLPGDMMNPGGSSNFADIKNKENLLSGMGPGMASSRDASGPQESGLNNEDMFKNPGDLGGGGGDDGQGNNEIKDLHKFLQAHPKYKARDEEEESERENAAFAESEAKAHESISGLNLGSKPSDRSENRLPEKEGEYDRDEPHGPFGDEYDKGHSERSRDHPRHDDKPEPNGLGPGMGMLKPGGPEVPRLENLLGGGQPQGMFGTREQGLGGPSIPDMGGDGTGPYGLPTGAGAGRFVSDNNKNMMESNSDYNVPKTAFSGLWKDYMLTTQSQLADKDPSANSRQIIHHPHHGKNDMKKRDFVKRAKTRKHANVEKKSKLTKRSTPEVPPPVNSTATAQNETTSTNTTTTEHQTATTKDNLANTTAASASSAPQSNDTLTLPSNGTSNVVPASNQSSLTDAGKRSNDTVSVTFPSSGGTPTVSGNTSNVIIANNQSSLTKAIKKSNLKTMDVQYRSNDLPPVYLTVRNGRKMLVVHPTAEFLSSLPRINFTESYTDKRAVGTPVRTKLVKHDDVAKAPTVSKVKLRNEIPEKEKEEHDDDYDEEDKESDDDDNSDEEDGKENGDDDGKNEDKDNTGSSEVKRSNIAYVDVPVISPEPDGVLDHWVKEQTMEKNKLYRRDLTKNFDPRELNTKFDPTAKDFDPMSNTQNLEAPTSNQSPLSPNSNFPQEEFQGLNAPPSPLEQQQQQQPLEQKSKPFFQQTHDSLPLPNEIQSLYKEYAAQGKSNFQYEPSRDEVAEELQFAQKQNANQQLGGKEHIQTMDTSDMQAPNTGHIQQQMETQGMESGGNLPLNQASHASRGSRTQAPWEGMLGIQGMQEAEGSKRSVKSAVVTRGFGPITVEAKTADAPMSDA